MNKKITPMLAYNGKYDLEKDIRYPVYASIKYDGMRIFNYQETWMTRSGKDSVNLSIMKRLAKYNNLLMNCDCELLYGKTFHEGQALIRSQEIDIEKVELPEPIVLVVHDIINSNPFFGRFKFIGFKERVKDDKLLVCMAQHWRCDNAQEVKAYLRLNPDAEGLMLRSPEGIYKFGRSTLDEQYLVKYINVVQEEATIVALQQMFSNTKRGTKRQKWQVPLGMVGSFLVESEKWGSFNLSGRLTENMRKEMWLNRTAFHGKKVVFEYKPHGSKDKPRQPIFVRFAEES